ncbi:MAG: hypothetical protein ACRC7S_10235 [Cetobacterium sp.]
MKTFLILIISICILRVSIPLVFWDGSLKHVIRITANTGSVYSEMFFVAITFIMNSIILLALSSALEKVLKTKF